MIAMDTTLVAWLLLVVIVIGWLAYWVLNLFSARRELGSEIEMAPNRKPYYDDEVLEGRRLERMQILAVLLLITLVVGLPLYWMFEPDRQAGAVSGKTERFRWWGEELFMPTASGGFNCSGCHGGMAATGGQAPYAVTDVNTGEVKSVNWYAPALNTVFYRFSQDEVRFILNYGRPFSPMSAWGAPGGGPMTEQNIETLLVYLESIQVQPEGCLTNKSFVDKADPYVCDGGTLPQTTKDEIQASVDAYLAANPQARAAEQKECPPTAAGGDLGTTPAPAQP